MKVETCGSIILNNTVAVVSFGLEAAFIESPEIIDPILDISGSYQLGITESD